MAEKGPSAAETERKKITGRAGIVAAGTLFSRVLGLVRDQVLAAIFSRAATDAFFVACDGLTWPSGDALGHALGGLCVVDGSVVEPEHLRGRRVAGVQLQRH